MLSQVFRQRYLAKSKEDEISAAIVQDKTELMSSPPSERDARRQVVMKGVLELFSKELGSKGVPLRVLIVPSIEAFEAADNAFVNEKALVSLCEKLDLNCLNLLDVFSKSDAAELYDPKYRHLNRSGAAVAGKALADFLRPVFSDM